MTEGPRLVVDVCFAEKRLLGQIEKQERDLRLFTGSERGSSCYALNSHHMPAP